MARSLPTDEQVGQRRRPCSRYRAEAHQHYETARSCLGMEDWQAAIAYSLAGLLAHQNAAGMNQR